MRLSYSTLSRIRTFVNRKFAEVYVGRFVDFRVLSDCVLFTGRNRRLIDFT